MKRFVGLFTIVLFLAASLFGASQAAASPSSRGLARVVKAHGKGISGQYIVVLKQPSKGKVSDNARAVADTAGVTPMYEYDTVLHGFAAQLNPGQLNALQHNPNVDYIEQDQIVTTSATQIIEPTGDDDNWGLDRIDQRDLPLSGTYTYNNTGAGVYAYIIDTGLDSDHIDFGGRAQNVYDAFGEDGEDCDGHGTHVGGIVGGQFYGVAKQVNLRGVRVLNCDGDGTDSGIIAALNWLSKNARKPAVANMSLGGSYSESLNTAVNNLVSSGVFVAVAAGNENVDACTISPASAVGVFTVAASDKTDTRASFSNYGDCVDGYAPGVDITSDHPGNYIITRSGTSMAAPHVAGVAALYKQSNPNATPFNISAWLYRNASLDKIKGNPEGTPNVLLFKGNL